MRFAARPSVAVLSAILASCLIIPSGMVRGVEEKPDSTPGPMIKFDRTTHDLGKMNSDERREFAWEFSNVGNMPLEVLKVRTSCGCTATFLEETRIPPGGNGRIDIVFDASGISGSVRKTITVSTNDVAGRYTILTLLAEVTLVEEEAEERDGHPRTAGRSLFSSDCASCHAAPAAGKTGNELYAAICAMCHGPEGTGGIAPSLRPAGYLASRSSEDIEMTIAYGTADPHMPGYIEMMGGPLSQAQVNSLLELIETWQTVEYAGEGDPASPR